MNKLLLSFCSITLSAVAFCQFSVIGVSPASIAGQYDHGVQAGCGAYPGVTDDGTWNTLSNIDFNIPGTFIQDTLMMVDDATAGTNPQGNPIAQEGCNPLVNDLTGKIAVAYRNTCYFSSKVAYAEQAGAVAIIIINREAGVIDMAANTDPVNGPLGTDCTIPAVFLDQTDGQALVDEMANGPVVMFIGNKLGAFSNDAGAYKDQMLIPNFAGANSRIFDGVTPGIQVYNFGANTNDVSVQCTIDGPSGNVYDETVTRLGMVSGDTMPVFAGNAEQFTPWTLGIGNYENGDYTMTYTITCVGQTDDAADDNVLSTEFTIQDDVVSLARVDGSGNPVANSYPSNSTTNYYSCMFFEDPNASTMALDGILFVPFTDTSVAPLEGEQITLEVYEWNDPWTDLNDPNYSGAANNDWFQSLNSLKQADYYPASDNETGQVQYIPINPSFALADNQRYLVCLQSFNPEVAFGYDNEVNYDGNQGIYAMPQSPVNVDDTWYTGGWSGTSAPSISLIVKDASLADVDQMNDLNGKVYPNPGVDKVTIVMNANGAASVQLIDITGKSVLSSNINLKNGKSDLNIESLVQGIYIVKVTLENGMTSQFNFVKN